ncbi:hypothetical protein WJ68_16025 [Burkholderia ubonensis]|uniref:Uncharacterized protein n=1 Tax=Burkholderia ubonensis TaxID=101571 RepID=A0ABD4E0R9_9BURK|nr:hypothetical protein WJ68_16025 [Burkholderia ubonensis]
MHDRGRQFIGKDRHFDLAALAALVNGNEVQERVKNRDLNGFYGHWIRARFGLTPPESIVFDGRMVNIEPAFVTTHLSADAEGNITHEAEFLDTNAGAIAERLFKSKQGGFSSAIHAEPRFGKHMPTVFAGFDYVFEPNYTTNRGYVFDSAGFGSDQLLFDAVAHEWQMSNAMMRALFDSMQADHLLAMQTIERLSEENAELLSLAAKSDPKPGAVLLDSTGGHTAPLVVGMRATSDFLKRAQAFSTGKLVQFDKLPSDDQDEPDDPAMAHMMRGLGA